MTKLLKIMVAVDRWKLATFEDVLIKKGYEYKVSPGVTNDTLNIFILAVDIGLVKDAVIEAQRKCELIRKGKLQ